MKIESFKGIVLSEINYSESSKILNVLTDKYGKIGIMSKGCRNMKSKLRGVSRKLIYGTFHVYYKEKQLSTLVEVDVLNSFSKTSSDYERGLYALLILDLTAKVVEQNDDPAIFELLRDVLIKFEDGLNPLALSLIYELKCLDYLGCALSLDGCSICGSTKGIVSLSYQHGGYICNNCHTNEAYVDEKTIKMIRLLYYVDVNSISKLDISSKVLEEINSFLDEYYDNCVGIYLKSKDSIKKLIF